MFLVIITALCIAVHVSASLEDRAFCDKHLYFERELQCLRFDLKYFGQIYCEGVTDEIWRNDPQMVHCVSTCLALVVRRYTTEFPKFPYTLYRCNQIAKLTKDKFPDCYEICAFCTLPYTERQIYFDEDDVVGLSGLCPE